MTTTTTHRLDWSTGREYITATADLDPEKLDDIAAQRTLREEMIETLNATAAVAGWPEQKRAVSFDMKKSYLQETLTGVTVYARIDEPRGTLPDGPNAILARPARNGSRA